jgi:hypothetical protein
MTAKKREYLFSPNFREKALQFLPLSVKIAFENIYAAGRKVLPAPCGPVRVRQPLSTANIVAP